MSNITVIGGGYVGLVTAACFCELGHRVTCVEESAEKVASITAGRAPFFEPGLDELLVRHRGSGMLRATTDIKAGMENCGFIFIAVGTPDSGGDIDLSYVETAARSIGHTLSLRDDPGAVVIVKSTITPGTTEELVASIVRAAVGKGAERVRFAMNPEFLRQGYAVSDFLKPDRIVIGGEDEETAQRIKALYQGIDAPFSLTTPRSAELIKYANNSLLATLISFSNELANICELTESTDIEAILSAVHLDRRITARTESGTVVAGIANYLRAGCGFGGSCLPKDTNALRAYASRIGTPTPLLDSVAETNAGRPKVIEQKLVESLGNLDGRRVAILGLAFKEGTDDLRNSPAVSIATLLHDHGVDVVAWDPVARSGTKLDGGWTIPIKTSLDEALTGAEAAVIATAWPEIGQADWTRLIGLMDKPLIVDGRRSLDPERLPPGVDYLAIGRHWTQTPAA